MKLTLLSYPHESLKTVCEEVKVFDNALASELDEMAKIMLESGGVGLAANQVGLNKRMFVMTSTDGRLYDIINPEVLAHGELGAWYKEGCLSSMGVYETLDRFNWVQIKCETRTGESREFYTASYRDSVCVQHEIDHLNGIMWWDKLPKNAKKRLIRKFEKRNSK